MDSKIKIELIELFFILLITVAIALVLGMFLGAGAVNRNNIYLEGQQSCAVCQVKMGVPR